eukprot:CAMPEP_0175462288 /NCGR_PEP_ID=MMETSP0095-20121207/68602_1 /TAXON_ID=311494 /ORGANISM="Alexandrium monilatum, Strain CCMP3105" /LENGTH=62 /DNA_ID=CAMNT_0016763375 /DNA_START=91 /DNA_END=275 /DNA_ORIENTATION=-
MPRQRSSSSCHKEGGAGAPRPVRTTKSGLAGGLSDDPVRKTPCAGSPLRGASVPRRRKRASA